MWKNVEAFYKGGSHLKRRRPMWWMKTCLSRRRRKEEEEEQVRRLDVEVELDEPGYQPIERLKLVGAEVLEKQD